MSYPLVDIRHDWAHGFWEASMRFCRAFAALFVVSLSLTGARADDWIFDNGPYTVNPETGARVEQYKKPKEPKPVPYDKFFSNDGPHPYIPWWYYEDEEGWPGYGYGFGDVPYGNIPFSAPFGGAPAFGPIAF
jgi:hypothetical protein